MLSNSPSSIIPKPMLISRAHNIMLKRLIRHLSDDPYSKIKPKFRRKEFYLNSELQYMYTPTERIEFTDGKAQIYSNSKYTLKLAYLPKLCFSVLGLAAVAHSNAMLDFSILIHIVLGITGTLGIGHSVLGARVLNSVYLKEDGRTVDITYKYVPLLTTTKTFAISEFRPRPTPVLMLMWSLNPMPRNMLGFLEAKVDDLLPMYLILKKHSFFLLHRKPEYVNEEIFANVCNGVSINTRESRRNSPLFKDRYKEITSR